MLVDTGHKVTTNTLPTGNVCQQILTISSTATCNTVTS